MRPILLKIAGLNSFREGQEIDFTKLCETGVFGIFGSTGSGKSTILDAITLALYGTVERAANNTQGILNHAEDQLSVEYSFSLATGSQRITYRAQRAYRRSGDRTVKASTCRLIEITDGEETVLASKADEMTKKMEDILGLTVEDFTRAVVLPQGKFAEFLTIKPKDRRLMLERLFSLEAYGRELSTRLTEQLRSTDYQLNGVEQRQQGLGDASAEQVKSAEIELKAATASANKITKELKSLKQQYDDAKEIWGLQEQLQQIQKKEIQLTAAQFNINGMVERLSLAKRAETIRPILEELVFTEERFKGAQRLVEDVDQALKLARLEKESTERRWSQGNLERIEAEPRCLRRLEQLEQAKNLEVDIQSRLERLSHTRLKYAELSRTQEVLEQKLQAINVMKTQAQKQQQVVKKNITQITVDPTQRARVNASAQALEGYEIISKQVSNLEKDFEKNTAELNERQLQEKQSAAEVQNAQKSVEHLKEILTTRQGNPPTEEAILSEWAQELERYRYRISNIERAEREAVEQHESLLMIGEDRDRAQTKMYLLEKEQSEILVTVQESTAFVVQITTEVKALEHENLAGLLVEDLVEGESCPVCGSSHHPTPAQSLDNEILKKARNDLDQASGGLLILDRKRTDAVTALAVAKVQLSLKKEREQNQLDLANTKKLALVNERKELPENDLNKDTQVLNAQRVEQQSKLAQTREVLNQWRTDHDQLNQKLEYAQLTFAEVAKKQHNIEAQIASIKGVGTEIYHRLNQLLEEQVQRKSRLDTLRESIAPLEIFLLQKRYITWDETMRDLSQELSGLEERVRESDEAQLGHILEKTNCELELQNLKTVGIEAARDTAELQRKCDALTEGKPALERTLQVKQELAQVTGTEETLRKAYDLAKEIWTKEEQTRAVSHRTMELSREGFEVAQRKLEKGLETAQFMSASEAQIALCDEAERLKMNQDILAFQQDVLSLKQKREDVEDRLTGRSLRPEEWLAAPIRLREVENTHTEAIERRGATQQRLEKLNEEHKEWMRLEHERKTLSHREGLLKSLQTVFKGNAFVEFIAQ